MLEQKTKVLSHTEDGCIIWTNQMLRDTTLMKEKGWTMVDMIPDDYMELGERIEAYVICFARGELLKQIQ